MCNKILAIKKKKTAFCFVQLSKSLQTSKTNCKKRNNGNNDTKRAKTMKNRTSSRQCANCLYRWTCALWATNPDKLFK